MYGKMKIDGTLENAVCIAAPTWYKYQGVINKLHTSVISFLAIQDVLGVFDFPVLAEENLSQGLVLLSSKKTDKVRIAACNENSWR